MLDGRESLRKTEEFLAEGDAHGAFGAVRCLLEYPETDDELLWEAAQPVFARVCGAIAGGGLQTKIKAAASRGILRRRSAEGRARRLYDLGEELVEHQLHGIAATYLARANALVPGTEKVLTSTSLPSRGPGATRPRQMPDAAPESVIADSTLCRYLLSFNRLASGQVDGAREAFATLDHGGDKTLAIMLGNIDGMLNRHEAFSSLGRESGLSDRDLRGWHFVMNGGLLLHRCLTVSTRA